MVVTITMIVAVLAVLAAIVVLAMGRGGELSASHPDYPRLPSSRHAVAATDVALTRLPLGLWWGYHQPVTDEAVSRFAQVLADRDIRIAVLEQHLAEARRAMAAAAEAGPSPADATAFDTPVYAPPTETPVPPAAATILDVQPAPLLEEAHAAETDDEFDPFETDELSEPAEADEAMADQAKEPAESDTAEEPGTETARGEDG